MRISKVECNLKTLENMNLDEENLFMITTGRHLVKRKLYTEYKNSHKERDLVG